MQSISQIDNNFALETSISREGLKFYDAENTPFQIHGLIVENGKYRRMPEEAAKKVSDGVFALHACSPGGRVRFVTDSPYVAIKVVSNPIGKTSRAGLAGSCGFDMYSEYEGESRYEGTFLPPFDIVDGFESVKDFKVPKLRTLTINFPSYSEVLKLYIGLKDGALLAPAPKYTVEKPVVYYGSSVTQGGCAAKPGSTYQSILSRWFDCDYINLGFSGSAKGEDAITEYICNLDMSIFVLDYDYNAPTPEHLKSTHGKMYRRVREVHPNLPIVMMTRPKYYLDELETEFASIVYDTYCSAKNAGDNDVYFISGKKLLELVKDNGTVDGCHPTDSGFFSMACAIREVFEVIFKKWQANTPRFTGRSF